MKEQTLSYINQIFDFYKNKELSKGFSNKFFREGNPEEWVLPRLERAVKDEVYDDLLHSRYAIWSSNVCDLIDKAAEAVRKNNNNEALNELELARNTIMAYKDIQIVFDDESFYKINEVFKTYADHLLSKDDDISVIIDKEKIVRRLKNNSQVSGAALPRDIDVYIKNGVLKVFVKNISHNMQEDSAAFEAWILVLKTWLSGDFKYVELDFSDTHGEGIQYGTPEACHYNRFIYRINNMIRLFPGWFFIHDSKKKKVEEFMDWLEKSRCLLNHSLQERASVIQTDKMERQIESWFVFEQGKSLLCEHWGIDENKLFNQLPIGIFYNEIASKNAIFTRGASAVDIWGVSKDGKDLHLVELKCGDNKGVGVISEILFYLAVIYDTCISEKNLFDFGRYGNASDTKDMLAIKNQGTKFNRLYGHILAENYHPLFIPEVETLLNEGLSNLGIQLDRALYDYSKKVLYE